MESSEAKFLSIFKNSEYPNLLKLADAKLHTDDGCKFNVHRIILARNSKYFHAMFTEMDNGRKEFRIPDISGECLSDILRYLYTEEICLTEENVTDLLISADYLLLTDMYLKIKQKVKTCMTDKNCLKIFYASYLTDDQDIMLSSFRFIQTRFEAIIAGYQNELENLPANILYKILSSRSLYVYSENTVWDLIVRWTQKNTDYRLAYVPRLLSCLAVEDVEEKLAADILHHDIVSNNAYIVDVKQIKSSTFYSNRDILTELVQSYSDTFYPCYHRIPQKMYVITSYTGGWTLPYTYIYTHGKSNLYITYDENIDLWCKISEVDFRVDFLTVIEHNIYIFGKIEKIWVKFNLVTMDWSPMDNLRFLRGEFFIVAIEVCIYVFGQIDPAPRNYVYDVEIYDAFTNVWFDGVPLHDIVICGVVAIDNRIYVVGNNANFSEMVMKMFDLETREWTVLPPPNVFDFNFALVSYHSRIYLFGDKNMENESTSNAEVFDPVTAIWKVLPDIPDKYSSINAVVLDDRLIIYSDFRKKNDKKVNAQWNEAKECWEEVNKQTAGVDFHLNHFSIIKDVNLIRILTKRNRDPTVEIEKTGFFI